MTELLHDRGRGPEIVGTRITVYNLLPHLMDATATESYISRLYDLTLEQVAAARAWVLNNPETVLARHLEIEQRIAAGNPPEVIEQAAQTHAMFVSFKEWLTQSEQAESEQRRSGNGLANDSPFPEFREWLADREAAKAS